MTAPNDPLIGIDSFAYHRWFGEWNSWESPGRESWTTADFLDRAEGLGADLVSLQTVYLEGGASTESLRELEKATRNRQLGMVLCWGHRGGLEGGLDPQRLSDALRWLTAAGESGIELVRIVCGDQRSWFEPFEERSKRLVPMIGEMMSLANSYGMALAVENHADLTAPQLVTLIERVGADGLGICFDFGNAIRVGEELMEAVTVAAPWIRMVHVKDLLVQAESLGDPGAWWPTVPLGSGDLPLEQALAVTLSSPDLVAWLVEMANMHPSHPDEDIAVERSMRYLRETLVSLNNRESWSL